MREHSPFLHLHPSQHTPSSDPQMRASSPLLWSRWCLPSPICSCTAESTNQRVFSGIPYLATFCNLHITFKSVQHTCLQTRVLFLERFVLCGSLLLLFLLQLFNRHLQFIQLRVTFMISAPTSFTYSSFCLERRDTTSLSFSMGFVSSFSVISASILGSGCAGTEFGAGAASSDKSIS